MKKLNSKGFSAVELVLVLVIVGFIGFMGWYVWNQNKSSAPSKSTKSVTVSNKTSAKTNEVSPPSSFVSSANFKTVTENGITVSYPDNWDSRAENHKGLSINGVIEGDIVSHGFGAPFGYKYKGDGSWEHVGSEGVKIDDSQPELAPVNVGGASSTIIVRGGEGPCGGSNIVFAYQNRVYSVGLPSFCEWDGGDVLGVPTEDVTANLENIIKSIRVN